MAKELFLNGLSWMGRKLRRTPLAHLRWLNRLYAKLGLWAHGSNVAKVGPFRVHFDARDRVIAKKLVLHGGFETQEIALLCSLVRAGDHVLDVGANIGIYSLYLSEAVGPEGRVIAVEPDPDNLALLRRNLEVNGCKNVFVLPCAFGVQSGQVDLFQVDDNRGNLSFADVRGTGKSISVPMRRGEAALAELGSQPTVVKMDVEGAEPLVLAGLGYKPAVLLFEFAPPMLRALGQNPESFLESLVQRGYVIEIVNPDSGLRTRTTPAAITRLTDRRSANYCCNLLGVLSEQDFGSHDIA